ncbi:hypothetical protein AaE_012946 [Aphanomyces astaci]|uniref:Integrase catalytic domain-containing protein n=1 Tax=Aphanomyces astaci TaxID=112090 RepID=A0A6A4ZD37_APHAT|nr:hypothetical protein AaE_012946 [Aphanomyces astaci]
MSTGGCRYYTVYVNDNTGFKIVRFVSSTGSADQQSNLEAILAYSERQTGRKVKVFRSDGGPEYSSRALDDLLQSMGIKHESSSAGNQWQNGVAERAHRTLMEMALAMLAHANMSNRWWAEAVNTAAFICNRVLQTTKCVKTPLELFCGHVPTLNNMRVFGCKCFKLVKQPERRNKLAPKATLCIMLGYMDSMKAYKLYDVEEHKMTHGVHVTFMESEFFGHSSLPDSIDDDDDADTTPNSGGHATTLVHRAIQAAPTYFESAVNTVRRVVDNAVDAILPADAIDNTPPDHMAPTTVPRRLVNPTPHHSTRSTTSHFRQAPTTAPAAANTSSAFTRPSYFKAPHMRSGPNDTGRLKHPDQFRNEMNAARRQALAASPSFATPSPDPSRHLAFDSEHPLPKRIPKPNPRYASMALAEVALDADLEGYQYDYDSFMGENTVTYRVDGVEYACAAVQVHPVPNSHREAMASPDWRHWKAAEEAEVAQLLALKCWTVQTPPPGRKVIQGRWTYARKTDAEGNVIRWKARWVLKGFSQIAGVDYDESSSNVIKMTSIRAICAVATSRRMVIEQADAVNAYIQATLGRPIWAVEPEGHVTQRGKAALVTMALYGLNQSGHEFEKHCKKQIASLGWAQSAHDPCVFTRGQDNDLEILGTYVDDFIVATPTQEKTDKIMTTLAAKIELKRQGPVHYLLGIRISRNMDEATLTMSQDAYAAKVLDRFGMTNCHPVATPELADQEDLWHDENQPSVDQGEYRAMIGSLVYLMVCTRPDIAHAVQRLSCHLHAPRTPHLLGAKRVLRYLSGTKTWGIQFGTGEPTLGGYCDASWATRPDRRSTTGFLWSFLGGPLMWKSVRQRITALSSCEAEYIAAAEAARESSWLRGLMTDLGVAADTLTLHCDNMSAIATSKSTAISERTKHIDVRHHYLRELVQAGALALKFVPTTEMRADALTKVATKFASEQFRKWSMANCLTANPQPQENGPMTGQHPQENVPMTGQSAQENGPMTAQPIDDGVISHQG